MEGCISDRKLLEKSGLLDWIEPGDHILADRGFGNCQDLVAAKQAHLIYPPFKPKNNEPMSIKEIARGEAIARARIHIG